MHDPNGRCNYHSENIEPLLLLLLCMGYIFPPGKSGFGHVSASRVLDGVAWAVVPPAYLALCTYAILRPGQLPPFMKPGLPITPHSPDSSSAFSFATKLPRKAQNCRSRTAAALQICESENEHSSQKTSRPGGNRFPNSIVVTPDWGIIRRPRQNHDENVEAVDSKELPKIQHLLNLK